MQLTREAKISVQGDNAIVGEECVITAGGISWHNRKERVKPSNIDRGNSVQRDIAGTHGKLSASTVSAAYNAGIVGENMNDGEMPSQGSKIQ